MPTPYNDHLTRTRGIPFQHEGSEYTAIAEEESSDAGWIGHVADVLPWPPTDWPQAQRDALWDAAEAAYG